VREADLWIHRKGAIDAHAGERAIIPGSMGDTTFHVEGRGCAEALWSASHGAGRSMSRTEARRRVRVADLERDVRGVWLDRSKLGRLVDEAPAAYKDISKVMRAQRELVRVVRRLQPLLSFKGA
jgi:tRNA-splicing ligase RtcB